MIAQITTASASSPPWLESATTKNTGIAPRRAYPIGFGFVLGFRGWSDIVAGGGGPDRSIPNSLLLLMRGICGLTAYGTRCGRARSAGPWAVRRRMRGPAVRAPGVRELTHRTGKVAQSVAVRSRCDAG